MPEVGLRDLLRSATSEIHERLHHHEGMAAIQSGNIDQPMYVALLRRLYGFHKPFEAAAEIAPDRTGWLESDLAVFGVDAEMRTALSFCTAFPENPSAEYILGARYVVEGSALGGQGLARKLDGLKGIGVIAGPAVRLDMAIELAKKETFDVALLDVNLDGKMSWEVSDVLNAREIPFIFTTGYGQADIMPDHLAGSQVLAKPYNSASLAKRLSEMMAVAREAPLGPNLAK
jgi:CheY-like chemotaxis protein